MSTFRLEGSAKRIGADRFKHFVTSVKRVGVEAPYEYVPREIAVLIYASMWTRANGSTPNYKE